MAKERRGFEKDLRRSLPDIIRKPVGFYRGAEPNTVTFQDDIWQNSRHDDNKECRDYVGGHYSRLPLDW